jgi:hypothetical protein
VDCPLPGRRDTDPYKGQRGEKRPAGAIETAIKVTMISTGEIEEDIDLKSAAAELRKLGGKARASTLTPERRREIARKAAIKRWSKHRNQST